MEFNGLVKDISKLLIGFSSVGSVIEGITNKVIKEKP